MQTASAIGDDRLRRRAQGYIVPDRWFMTGLKTGQVAGIT
jgi:predicted metalloprotease